MTALGRRIDDWRPAPFGRIRKVLPMEAARWRGEREYIRTHRRRDWLPAEVGRLTDLVEAGTSYDQIARTLRRSREAILVKCNRLGVRITTTNATLSARDVARALGLGCAKTVVRWIGLGWLPARNAGSVRPLWRVTWEDLLALMERREMWMAWEPARIADPALREWATELRAGQSRWLTPGAVARRLGVDRATPHQWIAKGWLPATKYGNWWIWEADLIGFTVPGDRPRSGRYKRISSHQPILCRLRSCGPQTATDLASALSLRPKSVGQALRTLERRGWVRRVGTVTDWKPAPFGRIRKELPLARKARWEAV